MTSNHLTSNDIRQLLDKFYAGASTPAEEALLTQYFLSHSSDDGFEDDRRLFIAMARARQSMPPADLEKRIVAATCGRRRFFTPGRAAAAAVIAIAATAATFLIPRHHDSGETMANDNEPLLSAVVTRPDTVINSDTVKRAEPVKAPEPAAMNASRVRQRKPEAIAQAAEIPASDSAQIAAARDLIDRMLSGSFTAVSSGMNQAVATVKAVDKTVNAIIK